jgi:hypothetical protein
MNNWTISLVELPFDSDKAVATVTNKLQGSGMGVLRSFDLRSACAAAPDQTCPHHGKSECDCQLVVLMVLDRVEQPASLMLHTYNGQTQIGLAASPGHQPSERLEKRLRKILRQPEVKQVAERSQ